MSTILDGLNTDDLEGLQPDEIEELLDLAEAAHEEHCVVEELYDENGPVAPNV